MGKTTNANNSRRPHAHEILVASNKLDEKVIKGAKQQELHSWSEFGVYMEVPDREQGALSHKWICTEMLFPDGTCKSKARLVAKEFEENLEDQDLTVIHLRQERLF